MIINRSGKSIARGFGQSLIEVTVGIVALIIVVMTLVDLAIMVYGVSLNDSACRNAALASASGNPADAERRARAVLDQVNSRPSGSMVSHFSLVLPVKTDIISQPEVQRDPDTDRLSSPGGLVTGSTTVTTEVEIRPFALHIMMGRKLPLKFRSQQTLPIRYIMSAR